MQTLAQNFGVASYLVPVARSNDSSLSASSQAAWVSLKGYTKATFIVQCGAMTEADTVIKAYQAKDVSGTSVSGTALAIGHYWSNKASVATAILTRTAATSDGVVVDATSNAVYVFEVDAKMLNATSDFDCVGLGFAGISAATLFGITAILHDPRYASDPMVVNVNA